MDCNVASKCGGCQYLHLEYEEELKQKTQKIRDLLGSICRVDDIIPSKQCCHYRNKVTGNLKFVRGEKGKVATRGKSKGKASGRVLAGIYAQGSHEILFPDNCQIENENASRIITDAAKLLGEFGLSVYNEDKGRGLLRHLQVRFAANTGQYMLTVVTAESIFPSARNFCKALLKIHPEITTIVQNINTRTDSMILGTQEKVLYGRGFIEDTLMGLRFRISSASFYQVNSFQTEKLYQTAFDLLKLSGTESLLDAYSGTGTIGLLAAKRVKSVTGVEINGDAVADAKDNAKRNGITNAHFYKGDAGRFMVNSPDDYDVVIMDPPRSGSSKEFLDCLLRTEPSKIAYISCGPDALKRDLIYLQKKYEVKRIVPVDMFPRTDHVESIVLLSRKTCRPAKDYIKVGIDAEEYYDIKAVNKE